MKKKPKKHSRITRHLSKEEERPKKRKLYHKRRDVKNQLKNWKDSDWEELGSDSN